MRISISIFFFLAALLFSPMVLAQTSEPTQTPQIQEDTFAVPSEPLPPDEYMRAKVTEIIEEGQIELPNHTAPYQELKVQVLDGPEKGEIIEIAHGKTLSIREEQKVRRNEVVVVVKSQGVTQANYFIVDKYRLQPLLILTILFVFITIVLTRKRGFAAIIGLAITLLILMKLIVPNILLGRDAVLVTLVGSILIVTTSLYLAHGRSRRTTIAVASTLVTLLLSVMLAQWATTFVKLFGLGSEAAYLLQFGTLSSLDLRGLLLAGIMIGTLGVLDDITTAQSAIVEELHGANSKLSFAELYRRGLSVGKEHIVSLVNTLVLAYAGASFPLFLLFATDNSQPLWVTLNSEFMSEEIVRTLVGSTVLVLAVPITTAMAAYIVSRYPEKKIHERVHDH